MSRSREGVRDRIIQVLESTQIEENRRTILSDRNVQILADAILEVLPKSTSSKWRVESDSFNESGFATKKEARDWFASQVSVEAGKMGVDQQSLGVYLYRAITGPGKVEMAWVRSD